MFKKRAIYPKETTMISMFSFAFLRAVVKASISALESSILHDGEQAESTRHAAQLHDSPIPQQAVFVTSFTKHLRHTDFHVRRHSHPQYLPQHHQNGTIGFIYKQWTGTLDGQHQQKRTKTKTSEKTKSYSNCRGNWSQESYNTCSWICHVSKSLCQVVRRL